MTVLILYSTIHAKFVDSNSLYEKSLYTSGIVLAILWLDSVTGQFFLGGKFFKNCQASSAGYLSPSALT